MIDKIEDVIQAAEEVQLDHGGYSMPSTVASPSSPAAANDQTPATASSASSHASCSYHD